MENTLLPPFLPGDPVPDFTCRSSNNAGFHFNTAAGRYCVLSFFGSATIEPAQALLRLIYEEMRPLFDDHKLCFFGVSMDAADEGRLQQLLPGIRLFWDFDGAVSKQYGALQNPQRGPGEPIHYKGFTLVLDPLQRVIAAIPLKPEQEHRQKLQAVLAALPPLERYSGVQQQAPVLVLPRVFEPEFCRALIAEYQQDGGYESGFMREKEGKTIGVLDDQFKRRRDYMVTAPERIAAIQYRITRRLVPEIARAFCFPVTRMERYLVACYDAESGGFFKAHRDNTTKGTAHRRFAVTINLNAEEFEGGELRFPEFGPATYRAPTGGAVVFSCSLLHEAMPVTKGTRYAFLPFLYDDAAAEIREENRAYLTGETYRV